MERAIVIPFSIDESGAIASSNDPHRIWQSRVIACVMTNLGERVHRPSYGGAIQEALFSTQTEAADIVRNSVSISFSEHLPQLSLTSVSTSMDINTGELSATIYYALPSGDLSEATLKTGFLTRSGEIIQE